MSSSVQVASLPLEDAANPVGIPGLVTGWTLGEQVRQLWLLPLISSHQCFKTWLQDKSTPNHLMKVNATVVANMACNDFMLGQMICTDYPRTHDSKEDCTGDFGGAFAVKNYYPGEQGGFTLLGIVRQNRGCGSMQDNYPEVYLKVAHYVSWINQTKKDNWCLFFFIHDFFVKNRLANLQSTFNSFNSIFQLLSEYLHHKQCWEAFIGYCSLWHCAMLVPQMAFLLRRESVRIMCLYNMRLTTDGATFAPDPLLTRTGCWQVQLAVKDLWLHQKVIFQKRILGHNNTNKMHYFFWKAVKIVAGALNLNQAETGMGKQHRDASKVIIHPEFDTSFLSDDMCMIKVNSDHFMSHMHDGFFFWKTHATGWQQFWSDW